VAQPSSSANQLDVVLGGGPTRQSAGRLRAAWTFGGSKSSPQASASRWASRQWARWQGHFIRHLRLVFYRTRGRTRSSIDHRPLCRFANNVRFSLKPLALLRRAVGFHEVNVKVRLSSTPGYPMVGCHFFVRTRWHPKVLRRVST